MYLVQTCTYWYVPKTLISYNQSRFQMFCTSTEGFRGSSIVLEVLESACCRILIVVLLREYLVCAYYMLFPSDCILIWWCRIVAYKVLGFLAISCVQISKGFALFLIVSVSDVRLLSG
jgi:hypothetical protein